MQTINKSGGKWGMIINVNKTNSMKFTRSSSKTAVLKIGDKVVENVDRFRYLGTLISNDGRNAMEIKTRIAMAK